MMMVMKGCQLIKAESNQWHEKYALNITRRPRKIETVMTHVSDGWKIWLDSGN